MKKFILLLILIGAKVFSQDIFIPDNPYDNSDRIVKSEPSFKSERWFYEQRMFPNNYIPEGAYGRAIEQRNYQRQTRGFYTDAVTWSNIGPTPGFVDGYAVSGRTTAVKYDPVNPAVIYIGAAFGGVWRSSNGGINWIPLTDFEVSLSSGSLAIDAANTNIIYYGTGEATYSNYSYYGRGILKSTNGGINWVNYTSGLPANTYCSRIIIRPGFPSQLFASMGTSGLYKSIDAGVSWVQVVQGRCDDIVFAPNGLNSYIIGSGTGYRFSTDGGVTFTQSSAVNIGVKNHISVCRSNPSVLYAAICTNFYNSIFKSTDAGLSFFKIGYGTNFDGGGQALYDIYIYINPSNPDMAFVGMGSVWRTTDGGTSFQNISYSVPRIMHTGQQNMDFNPVNPNELITVNGGGVWKSTDNGTTWINLNGSLTLTQFHSAAADPSNVDHIIGGTQDNGTQQTFGTLSYFAAFGSHGGRVCFHPANPQYIVGETQINSIEYSTNGGSSWQTGNNGLTGSGAWIGPIVSHPNAPGVFYTARQRVHKSTDWGASWMPISSGTEGTISELAISRSDPIIMYASWGNFIYKSTDAGVTFTNVSAGLPQRVITSIYFHPDSSDVAVISFSGFGAGKVYKTTNGASSWINISGDLPDSPVNDVLIYYPSAATSAYVAATDIGVFFTDNFGSSWIELSDGLPNTVAMKLDYHIATNRLRVATHGRGIWETLDPIGVINYNNETPASYSLSQNHPNPFNPITIIKYSITSPGFVKLAVYDILGREIKKIVSEKQNAGTYTAQFNGSAFSSGTYFYRLEANNYSETKKMILVK